MITIEVNGEEQSVPADSSIADLLLTLQINNRYCAVERNLQLVPREDHTDCRLQPGDRIEIVTLVGGG
ncbi:MAG: sulfur carrier protein ThiS [Fuerstiella sp.]